MAKPVAKFKAGQVSSALWENEITVNGRKVTVLKAGVQMNELSHVIRYDKWLAVLS